MQTQCVCRGNFLIFQSIIFYECPFFAHGHLGHIYPPSLSIKDIFKKNPGHINTLISCLCFLMCIINTYSYFKARFNIWRFGFLGTGTSLFFLNIYISKKCYFKKNIAELKMYHSFLYVHRKRVHECKSASDFKNSQQTRNFEMDAGGSVSLLLEPVSGLDIRNCICYMACLYENNVDIREDIKCIVIYIYIQCRLDPT